MRKKITNFISTHWLIVELITIFILLIVASVYNFLNSCQVSTAAGTDNQIFAMWKYMAIKGDILYKDTYYPYGLLRYLKHVDIFFSAISVLVMPLVFLSIFITLRKIWVNKWIVYALYASLLVFILTFTSIEIFERYGIIVSMALFMAYIFWNQIYCSKKLIFLLGISMGIVFPLVPDQGIYAFILAILLIFLNPILRSSIKELIEKRYFKNISILMLLFLTGFFPGFFMLALYFINKGMLAPFVFYMQKFPDFLIFAKTPFIPYSTTIDNIFTYIPVVICLFFLISRTMLYKRKLTFIYYVSLLLFLVIVVLEQKSMIRSISTQITFISFLLILVLGKEFDKFLSNNAIPQKDRLIFYTGFLIMVFTIKLQGNNVSFSRFIKLQEIFLSKDINNTLKSSYKFCLDQDVKMQLQANNAINDAKDTIYKDSDNPEIFDFLSDPIFYVLFQQNPPHYVASYEGGPLYAQMANLKYIKTNNINYVIFNLDFASTSDGVPAYARSNVLLKYVLTNFRIIYRNDRFIIFKKDQQNDLFLNETKNITEIKNYFLNINLAAIPKSEGLYKAELLYKNGSDIISNVNIKIINKYLFEHNISSSSLFIVLKPKSYVNQGKEMKIKLSTANNQISIVTFYRCEIDKTCVINVSNLPLFYEAKMLKGILVDENFKGEIKLVNNRTNKELW